MKRLVDEGVAKGGVGREVLSKGGGGGKQGVGRVGVVMERLGRARDGGLGLREREGWEEEGLWGRTGW